MRKNNEFQMMLQDATGSSCFVEMKVGEHKDWIESKNAGLLAFICSHLFLRCIRATVAVTTSRRGIVCGSVRWEIPLVTQITVITSLKKHISMMLVAAPSFCQDGSNYIVDDYYKGYKWLESLGKSCGGLTTLYLILVVVFWDWSTT